MENLNQNYRCSNCGGELGWDAAAQKWKCRFCDAEFTLEDLEKSGKTKLHEEDYEKGKSAVELGYQEATDDTAIDPADLLAYRCRYCGAEVITDKTTAATFCVYCNNPIVVEEQLVKGFRPRFVIPFAQTKKEAMAKYLEFIKKPFTPDSFMTEEHIEKVKGVYLPFWLYHAQVDGRIEMECEKIHTHRLGNTETTDHEVYHVIRGGNASFEKIPVDGSSRTDNALMDSIEPYDLNGLVPFEMPYLAGFMAERYDETDQTCYSRAKKRVEGTMEEKLTGEGAFYHNKKITKKSIAITECHAEYALLPVWLLYTQYNGQTYTFAMNGQTGVMRGNIPIDKGKMWKSFFLYSGIITGGLFFIRFLLALLALL